MEAFLGCELGEQGARTSRVPISWLRAKFAQCLEEADEEKLGTTAGRGSYTFLLAFSFQT